MDDKKGKPELEVQLSWDGGTSWTDAKETKDGDAIETTDILGGPSDTWGRSWTVDGVIQRQLLAEDHLYL